MKKNAKYLITLVLSGLIISCGTGLKEDQTETAATELTILNDFIIMAYSGPPPEETTPERYQEIADAGIEYLVAGNQNFSVEQNLKIMDLAMDVGIKIIPWDIRTLPFTANQSITIDTAALIGMVNDYKDHPALAAYLIMDEPKADLFPELKVITELLQTADPSHASTINVNPSYGPVGDDFRAYIQNYVETVKPKLLSYDHYSLRIDTTTHEMWFSDLAIVREAARAADIPYMVFVLSEAITNGFRVPDRAEILWQANTALAYGTNGVGWFAYWNPLPDHGWSIAYEDDKPRLIEPHYNAIIDLEGNRTKLYDYVKEENQYLIKAGKGLLGWDNSDAARFEKGELVQGSSPVITPEGVDANLIIGTFRKDERLRIVLSNSNWDNPATFSLKVSPDWEISGIFASIDATSSEGSFAEWTLEPGGSVTIDLK